MVVLGQFMEWAEESQERRCLCSKREQKGGFEMRAVKNSLEGKERKCHAD